MYGVRRYGRGAASTLRVNKALRYLSTTISINRLLSTIIPSTTTSTNRAFSTTIPPSPSVVYPQITIDLPHGNLAGIVLDKISRWPDRTALECSKTGRSYTYAEVTDQVSRCGGLLRRMGVERGDTIAVLMLNCPEYPIVLFAALSIGAGATVINTSYTSGEVAKQLSDSKAKLVIADEHTWQAVNDGLTLLKKPLLPPLLNYPTSVPTPNGHPNLRRLLEDTSLPFADVVEVKEEDLSFLPYSSGTTGNPKGVALSHSAFSSNLAMYTHPSIFMGRELDSAPSSPQDTFYCYLPFFHVYGLLPLILAGMTNGIRLVTVPKFDAKTFVRQVAEYKLQTLHLVPSVLNFLMNAPEVTPESMKTVQNVLCGAAPVSPSAVKALNNKIQKKILFQEGYGMTEVLLTHVSPFKSDRTGMCGRPLPNVSVMVVDTETDQPLGPNQPGEILFKTPSMMNGYFNNEMATSDIITADGWVRSGDIGYYDEDEFFSIIDRTKELIKVKALQVSPSELEDILLQHPNVMEVAVVGVPDDRLGEAPRAYVVAKGSPTEKDIAEFLAPRVAPHKRLAGGVVFINELPKNATGKLLKRVLKQMAT